MAKVAKQLDDKQLYWSKCIGGGHAQGHPQPAFCASHKLALSTFQWWRTRLNGGAVAVSTPSFVPLSLVEATAAVVHIELRCGTRVRLEGEAALRAVDVLARRLK